MTVTRSSDAARGWRLPLDAGQRTLLAWSAATIGWILAWRLLVRIEMDPPLVWWWVPPTLAVLLLSGHRWLAAGRAVVLVAAVAVVFVPALRLAAEGDARATAIEATTLSQSAVHELRAGRNPYRSDHTDAVNRSAYPMDPGERFEGLQYPPLAWLPFPVLEAPARLLTGSADPRPTFGALAVLLAGLLAWRARSLHDLAWAAAASSSGFVAMTVTEGTHDMIVVVLLVAAVMTWHRPVVAALLIGFAASVKTLAWPLLPVAAIALLARRRRREQLRVLGALGLPLALSALPFLVWDPGAFLRGILFIDDLARPGTLSLRQPIIDLLGVDLAWPLRLAVVAGVLVAAWRLARRGRLSRTAAVLLMVAITVGVQLFSTVFYVYHLALPAALLVTAGLVHGSQPSTPAAPRRGQTSPTRATGPYT